MSDKWARMVYGPASASGSFAEVWTVVSHGLSRFLGRQLSLATSRRWNHCRLGFLRAIARSTAIRDRL